MEDSCGVDAFKSGDLLEWLRLGLEVWELVVGMGCVCATRDGRLLSGAGKDEGMTSQLEGRLLSLSLMSSSSNSSSGSKPGIADSIELVAEVHGGADISL